MFPEQRPLAWVFHVTIWLGDQSLIGISLDCASYSEGVAIAKARRTLMATFPEHADRLNTGPASALCVRLASDGEILSEKLTPRTSTA